MNISFFNDLLKKIFDQYFKNNRYSNFSIVLDLNLTLGVSSILFSYSSIHRYTLVVNIHIYVNEKAIIISSI